MELDVEDTKACYVEVGEEGLASGRVEGGSEDTVQASILGVTQHGSFSSPGMILKRNDNNFSIKIPYLKSFLPQCHSHWITYENMQCLHV